MIPPPVHLPPHKLARRDSLTKRAMPFSEPGAPRVTGITAEARCTELLAIVDYLDVEKSARYRRTPTSTWCNIFAGDVAYLAGIYLPHVFWTPKALAAFDSGVTPLVKYDDTVTELSANGLDAWMRARGSSYGWQAVQLAEAAQQVVNEGGFAIALAAKRGGIGHVSVVIPESAAMQATKHSDGRLVAPLQAQAGATNRRRFCTKWWTKPGYSGGLWVNVWTDPAELLKRAAKSAADLLG